jgi:hypothetical protein
MQILIRQNHVYLAGSRSKTMGTDTLAVRSKVFLLLIFVSAEREAADGGMASCRQPQLLRCVAHMQWWAKLLRLLTVNSLSYFVKIKY